MKHFFILVMIAVCFVGYSQNKNYVVLPYDYDVMLFCPCQDCKPTDLSKDDIRIINVLFKKCKKDNKNAFYHHHRKYNRQYVAMINKNGEKEVFVNCFCEKWSMFSKAKKEIVSVQDGGDCFFQFRVNLTTKKYYNFSINGAA